MSVSDEALAAYYEVRSLAEQRWIAAMGPQPASVDPLRAQIDVSNEVLYRERLGDLRGLAVGEVGPGSGDFVAYALAEGARSLLVMDIARERLDAIDRELDLASRGVPYRLIVADARRMDGVVESELDLLVVKEVIEHLPDYRPFLRECYRVLRPGGRLYLTTPNRLSLDLLPRAALRRIVPPPRLQGVPHMRQLFGHLYAYVKSEEAERLTRILPAGFREHIYEFAPRELLAELGKFGLNAERYWGTPPQMFLRELRPFAKPLLQKWTNDEKLSYTYGDDLRVIATRS